MVKILIICFKILFLDCVALIKKLLQFSCLQFWFVTKYRNNVIIIEIETPEGLLETKRVICYKTNLTILIIFNNYFLIDVFIG